MNFTHYLDRSRMFPLLKWIYPAKQHVPESQKHFGQEYLAKNMLNWFKLNRAQI